MSRNEFGEELRRLRREAGLNLADLADAIHMTITYVSDIERGKRNPPAPPLIKALLARVGRPDLYPRMQTLAVKSRQSVEIPVEGEREDMTEMLASLARRCGEGGLPEEVVRAMMELLKREGE